VAADVRIRWVLDVVDRASRPLLRQDREVRRNLLATDKTYGKLARTATSAAAGQVRASTQVARGVRQQGTATRSLSADLRALSRAQQQAVSIGGRLAGQAQRNAGALRQQAQAAREASRAQRALAQAQQGTGAVRSGAGAVAGAAGVAGTAGVVAGAVRAFAGFEQQIDTVAAVSGATRAELARLAEQAKALGGSTSFSAREVAAAMTELARAGFDTDQVMAAIPGTLGAAAASGEDLARTAAIQVSALNAFRLEAGQAGRVADVLASAANSSAVDIATLGDTFTYVAPVAGSFGQSLEDIGAAAAILGNVGISGSVAGTTLRRAFTSIVKPTDKTIEQLGRAGIAEDEFVRITQNAKGELRSLPAILGGLSDALRDVDGATRRRTLAQLFGTEALPGLLTLVDQGRAGIDKVGNALRNAEGTAERTAAVMRGNVAGAFDEFTGSLETAAITLVERFGPALQDGLKGAAATVGRATTSARQFLAGAAGQGTRAPGETRGNAANAAGERVGGVLRTVGGAVRDAAGDLLGALRPAVPFLQNVLLPLLEGVGRGVLAGVVGAFRVLVPVIGVAARVLGAIGRAAAPLRGVFRAVGTAIGLVFGGVILRGIGLLGRLGGVFRVIGAAARILAVPIRLVGAGLGAVGRAAGTALRFLGRLASTVGGLLGRALQAVRVRVAAIPGVVGAVGTRVLSAAVRVVGFLTRPFRTVGSFLLGLVRSGVGRIVDGIRSLYGRFSSAGRGLLDAIGRGIRQAIGSLAGIGGSIIDRIVDGIRGAAGRVASAIADTVGDLNPFSRRGGGATPGGYGSQVPILAAGGEVLVDRGRSFVIPGDPRSDSTLLFARPGSAILTGHGQQLVAEGASLGSALARQLPHFATGGTVGRNRRRGGLQADAFTTGVGLGREGNLPAAAVAAIREAIRTTGTQRDTGRGRGRSGGVAPGKLPGEDASRFGRMLTRARQIDAAQYPYAWGGGHGRLGVPTRGTRTSRGGPIGTGFDCSGAVSAVLGAGGLLRTPLVSGALMRWGIGGSGKRLQVQTDPGHVIMRLGSRWWGTGEQNPNGGAGFLNGNTMGSRGVSRTWPGFRRGGVVPRFRTGGAVGLTGPLAGATAAASRSSAALGGLARLLPGVLESQIESLRAVILRTVRAGGNRTVIRRLQAVVSLLDVELGRRVGAALRAVEGRRAGADRFYGAVDRSLRRDGVASDSSQGIGVQVSVEEARANVERRNVRGLERALATARRRGDRATIDEVQTALGEAYDAIDEAVTKAAELRRDQVRAQISERTGTAQFGTDLARSALSGLEVGQRLAGTADTPEGLRARAATISSTVVPALEAARVAAEANLRDATALGDVSAIREATLAVQQAGQDVGAAMADAADLVREAQDRARQAILDAAAAKVDEAGSGTTLASLAVQRLELEQRLAGTFEGGGQARADAIRQQVIPALEAEQRALEAQRQAAVEQGDAVLARQIAEAIAGKQNEVLQAQLDALEQVAENTDTRAVGGGSLAFTFGGETLTDAIIGAGNGA
jgi:TP901 family phage tail tape measure protein